jgi:Peptidase_C39 like family
MRGSAPRSIELKVPQLSQLAYPGGEVWCSPTSVSMILGYWSEKLHRPELARPVPEVAAAVYDPNWPGTGNWCFNMAYAGSFEGIQAFVTRMPDLQEVRKWISKGVPVALSVCYNRLRGLSEKPSGHLVVCAGFTESGDVIVLDPGTRQEIRKIIPVARLLHAWDHSSRTAYVIRPAGYSTSSASR